MSRENGSLGACSVRLIGVFLALTSLAGGATEAFPVNWSVGQTWSTTVKIFTPSEVKVSDQPDIAVTFTKNFTVEKELSEFGKATYLIKITRSDEDRWFFRAKIDKATMTIASVWSVQLVDGEEKDEKAIENPRKGDSSTRGYPEGSVSGLPKFPDPNQAETRTVFDENGKKLVQSAVFDAASGTANIEMSYSVSGEPLSDIVRQTWKSDKPWPIVSKVISKDSSGNERVVEEESLDVDE